LEVVNVTEVAMGIEAVDIDASSQGGSNIDRTDAR
jgi:hypothetical protein